MNDLELTVIDLLDEAIKHGKHNQASHGRRTARRRAYSAAYSEARAGGATPQEAREKAKAAGMERQAERDARLERLRNVNTSNNEARQAKINYNLAANAPLDSEEQRTSDIYMRALTSPLVSERSLQDRLRKEKDFARQKNEYIRQRDEALSNNDYQSALRAQRKVKTFEDIEQRYKIIKDAEAEKVKKHNERIVLATDASKLQSKVNRGAKLTKAQQSELSNLRSKIIQELRESFPSMTQSFGDDQIYEYVLTNFNKRKPIESGWWST